MSITTTALPVPERIIIDSTKTAAFREMSAQFGDGYQQVAPQGINFKIDTWSITWAPLTSAQKTTVETALDANGSWGVYTWIPLGETVSKKFRVTKDGYTRQSLNRGNLFSISCKLVQVFDV